jgi:regulatory protein YycH of two-component signal transduction system YycFG
MYILKEIVCLNLVVTTKIVDFSEDYDKLVDLAENYEIEVQELIFDVENGKAEYNYYQMCVGNNDQEYQNLVKDLSEYQKRQLKMKDFILPEFIKYEVVKLVKQLPFVENISI